MRSEIFELTETFFLNNESCVFTFDGLTLQWRDKSVSVWDFLTVDFVHSGDCCFQKRNLLFFRKISQKCEDYNTILVRFAEPYKKNKLRLNNVKIRGEGKQLTDWFRFLRCSLDTVEKNRPKEYLVLINPFSGRQNGVEIFMNKVKPLFRLANRGTTIVITKSLSDFGRIINCGTDSYDAILAVGGDGTVSEIVNSLITNQMETVLPGMNEEEVIVPKINIPIGIIPCGSMDCLAYTLNGTRDTETNALHAILGNRMHFDVCRATSETGENRFFISIFTFGYLTDLVKESEKFRWLGPMRYNYAGLLTLMRSKEYHGQLDIKRILPGKSFGNVHRESGKLSLVPKMMFQKSDSPLSDVSTEELRDFMTEFRSEINQNRASCSGDRSELCRDKVKSYEETKEDTEREKSNEPNNDEEMKMKYNENEVNCECNDCMKRKSFIGEEDSKNEKVSQKVDDVIPEDIVYDIVKPNETIKIQESSKSVLRLNPLITKLQESSFSEEFCITDRYFLIACANISCSSEIFPNGIAPDSFPGDGKMNIVLFKPNTICDMYKMYMKLTSREKKNRITQLPFISSYQTKRVKIHVSKKDLQEEISAICDGELFPHSIVDIKIHESIIQFYTRRQNQTI